MFMRPTRKSDVGALIHLFEPWFELDPTIAQSVANALDNRDDYQIYHSNVLESLGEIVASSLWILRDNKEVSILALNFSEVSCSNEAFERFVECHIVDWSKRGIKKVTTKVPLILAENFTITLKKIGFIFESISSDGFDKNRTATMTKMFCYRTAPYSKALEFLQEKLVSLGYETMPEANGFVFRIAPVYQRPFIIGRWHRMSFSENDIIVYPPAKKIEPYEIEAMFYPFRLTSPEESPALVTLEKRRACSILHIPTQHPEQEDMFSEDNEIIDCEFSLNNSTYSILSGHRKLRRGLPILFYVNGVGAIGEARIVDWQIETVSNLSRNLESFPGIIIEDLDQIEPKSAQVLKINFNYYKGFPRTLSFEEIKSLDSNFNPQRRRFVPNDLFESILGQAY